MNNIRQTSLRQCCADTWYIAKNTYKTWFAYWWWLIGMHMLLIYKYPIASANFWNTPFLIFGFPFDLAVGFNVRLIALSLFYVVPIYVSLYLSAKPTPDRKWFLYYMRYLPHALMVIGWFLLVMIVYHVVSLVITVIAAALSMYWNTTLEIAAFMLFNASLYCIALSSLFFIAALFEFEQINFDQIGMSTYTAIVKNKKLLFIVGLLWIIARFISVYVFNTFVDLSLFYRLFYIVGWIDLLIALPFLVIITTSIYYNQKSA